MRYALLAVAGIAVGCNTAWHVGGPVNKDSALAFQKGITTKAEVIGKLGMPDMIKGDIPNGNGVLMYYDFWVGSTLGVGCPVYYPGAYAPFDQMYALEGFIPFNRRCYQVMNSDGRMHRMLVFLKDGMVDDIKLFGIRQNPPDRPQ